jgi:predicted tellurium resistance membrane protein TerC
MLRTAAAIAAAVLVALVALRFVTGIVGGLLGAIFALAWIALKILIFVGIAYFVLTLVSPDTARKVRERVGGRPAL